LIAHPSALYFTRALHCDPYAINVQAHADPSKLGYKVNIQGRRVRIPRLAFIQYMEGAGV